MAGVEVDGADMTLPNHSRQLAKMWTQDRMIKGTVLSREKRGDSEMNVAMWRGVTLCGTVGGRAVKLGLQLREVWKER